MGWGVERGGGWGVSQILIRVAKFEYGVGGGSVRGGQVDGKVLERVAEGWQRGGGKGVWLQKWI